MASSVSWIRQRDWIGALNPKGNLYYSEWKDFYQHTDPDFPSHDDHQWHAR
jgi:hypothetical protein